MAPAKAGAAFYRIIASAASPLPDRAKVAIRPQTVRPFLLLTRSRPSHSCCRRLPPEALLDCHLMANRQHAGVLMSGRSPGGGYCVG